MRLMLAIYSISSVSTVALVHRNWLHDDQSTARTEFAYMSETSCSVQGDRSGQEKPTEQQKGRAVSAALLALATCRQLMGMEDDNCCVRMNFRRFKDRLHVGLAEGHTAAQKVSNSSAKFVDKRSGSHNSKYLAMTATLIQ